MPEMITRAHLVRQLLDMGVQPGGVLVVHTAFSKVRPVEGGPEGLIAALREALGPAGTLVMPGMTEDDDHPLTRARRPALAWAWSPIPSGGCRACCAPTACFPSGGRRRPPGSRPPTRPMLTAHKQPHRAGLRAGRAGAAAGDRSHRQYHHPPGRVPIWRALPAQEVRHSAPERPADAL